MNKHTKSRPPTLRRSALALLLAGAGWTALAAPTVPTVTSGQASFSQNGNVFSITNTPNTIINWQSFSVGAGEITRFIQQDANSAVLNRITGQDPSQILGALQSNGHVFLINPNGILFGKDARIDVNGLTASTLRLSDADFLSGKKNFGAAGTPASVKNEGRITTPSGGQVFLIAGEVSNSGIITAPNGQVVLAAGHTVRLVDSGNPDLHVVVSAPADSSVNLGQVIAQGGRIGIYGALVNQRGVLNANSAVLGENGQIVLKASRDAVLGDASLTSATGAGKGGSVSVLGDRVGMDGTARIVASGAAGGGTVLLGGDYQGKNAAVPHATHTVMASGASIAADATNGGDGGKVILWSDGATQAHGSISARGAGSGAGGLVETSGHALAVQGARIDTGAASGRTGSWLLDPTDITISNSGANASLPGSGQLLFADTPLFTILSPGDFASATADVLLQATGNITVNAATTLPIHRSLTLEANGNVAVNAALNVSGAGNVMVNGQNISLSSGGSINSTAGGIVLHAANAFSSSAGSDLKSSGYVHIVANNVALNGTIQPNGAGDKPSVIFEPANGAIKIDLGAGAVDDANTLGLSATELLNVDSNNLTIQGASAAQTGAFTVVGTLDLTSKLDSSSYFTLHAGSGGLAVNGAIKTQGQLNLSAGGSLTQSAPITADSLQATAGSVTLLAANLVSRVAGEATGGNFEFHNSTSLMVDGIDDSIGVHADSGNATISTNGHLTLNYGVIAGGAISLSGNGITGTDFYNRIAGSSLTLASTNGIGGLFTSVGLLNASNIMGAGSSPIIIDNDNPLQLGSVFQGGSSNAGGIDINSSGGLDVGSVLAAGGNVQLTATGPVNINGSVNSGGGFIVLNSNGNSTNINGSASLNSGAGHTTITGGTVQIAAGAAINTTSGNVIVVGSGIVHDGVITSNTGNVSFVAPATGNGSVSTSGTITGFTIYPSLDACLGGLQSPLCKTVLSEALTACIVDPGGDHCSQLLPSLATCIATPSLRGCSAVLPSLAVCVANPGTPGCVQVLPSLSQCLSTPSLPGCSVVLPSAASCQSNPNQPGCGLLPPTLSACIANPALQGCAAVLPTLSQCLAAPSLPGCIVVLPSVASCIANPSAPGCSAVLPSLSSCQANPVLPGCSVVLPSLASCLANPSAPGCAAVLPTLASCIANPALAGCSAILPSLAVCAANPATPGCSAVLPSLASCAANPSLPGCAAVLPTVAQCIVTPSLPGCASVLPTLSQCISAPTTSGCSAVLPSLNICVSAPATPGCSVVLPSLAVCAANPTVTGCSAVLPSLIQCSANPALAGCAAVLPTLATCVATPTAAGCSVVLPTLASCIANPASAGCAVVLPSLPVCATAPTTPGCSAVLPSLAQCVANPSSAACSAVLPTLSQCVATPTAAGCAVVLPTLAQCTASPTLQGCAVVLPPVNICLSNPAAAGCQVVLPPANNQPTNPVQQAINSTVNIINTGTTSVRAPAAPVFVTTPAAPTPDAGSSGAGNGSSAGGGGSSAGPSAPSDDPTKAAEKKEEKKEEKKDDKKDDKKEEKVSEKSEAKNEPPPPKTFCN